MNKLLIIGFIVLIVIAIILIYFLAIILQLVYYRLQRKKFINWAEEQWATIIRRDISGDAFLILSILNQETTHPVKFNGLLNNGKFLDIYSSKTKDIGKVFEYWGKGQYLFLCDITNPWDEKESKIKQEIADNYLYGTRKCYQSRLFLLTIKDEIYWKKMKGVAGGFIEVSIPKETWLNCYYVFGIKVMDSSYKKVKHRFNILVTEKDRRICDKTWDEKERECLEAILKNRAKIKK